MHSTNLKSNGLKYLNGLQLDDLCQLQAELDTAWKSGQSVVSNQLYDKVADSINYEATQLKTDPYSYVGKKTDDELKKLLDYLTQMHAQGKSLVDNAVWDVINQELAIRTLFRSHSNELCPPHWTAMSLEESPVQFIPLSRTSEEFQDLATYFTQSLGKSSVVIYSITRIQNLRLWYIFQSLQKLLSKNKRRLIHGTASPTHQKLVMYHGFHRSFCPNGLIGDGVYFAVKASYSNNDPYVLKRTSHRRELFICQVLVGNSTQGRCGFKSLPYGFHSAFESSGDSNSMFCIFNAYQAYPEYVVQYDYE